MDSILTYVCDCGEDFYEDDTVCVNCSKPIEKERLIREYLPQFTKKKSDQINAAVDTLENRMQAMARDFQAAVGDLENGIQAMKQGNETAGQKGIVGMWFIALDTNSYVEFTGQVVAAEIGDMFLANVSFLSSPSERYGRLFHILEMKRWRFYRDNHLTAQDNLLTAEAIITAMGGIPEESLK